MAMKENIMPLKRKASLFGLLCVPVIRKADCAGEKARPYDEGKTALLPKGESFVWSLSKEDHIILKKVSKREIKRMLQKKHSFGTDRSWSSLFP